MYPRLSKNENEQGRDMTLSRTALFVLCSGIVLTLAGCGGDDENAAAAKQGGGARPPARVRVTEVVEKKLSPRVLAVGTLTAVRTSTIASGANGVVEHYDVEEGQWVDAKKVLSKLRMVSSQRQLEEAKKLLKLREHETKESKSARPEEINAAKFRMNAAKIARDIAKKRYDRALLASRQGAINKEDMDEAEQRMLQTEKMYQEAEQNHKLLEDGPRKEKQLQAKAREEAQAENVKYLEAEHAKRTTLAPFAGYIVKEHTYIGQWLSKGDPVVTLAKLDQMDVIVNVDQTEVRHVRLGQSAKVNVQGFPIVELITSYGVVKGLIDSESATSIDVIDEKGQRHTIERAAIKSRRLLPWTGTIVQIVPKSEWKTGARGFPVKVRIDNRFRNVRIPTKDKTGKPTIRRVPVLKEGMMVTVAFEGAEQPMFMVPKDALIRSTQGMKVNIFRPSAAGSPKGSSVQVGVQTGISEGDLIQITVKPTNKGEIVSITPGKTLVVYEGGERLMPVHGNVIAVPKTASKKQ